MCLFVFVLVAGLLAKVPVVNVASQRVAVVNNQASANG